MTEASTKYPFPHPILTEITGKPDAASLRQLRKEVYANARAVHSERGGGANGHLGIVMPNAQYVIRTLQVFAVPVHPGLQPAHANNASSALITAVNRQYDKDIQSFQTYTAVAESLKQQIMLAVKPTYYQELDDDEMGMADVTPQALLTHLNDTYGELRPADLLANQAKLATTWNPEQPIENLWTHIATIRAVAIQGGAPINDGTTIELTLLALQTAGVYEHLIDTWNDKPTAEHTFANFKSHVILQEKTRLKKLTAKSAGYHAANGILQSPPDLVDEATPAATGRAYAATPQTTIVVDKVELCYCWTHGLQKTHNSTGCEQPSDGHQKEATALNRLGGSTYFAFGRQGGKPKKPAPVAPRG
jgi:hypothetical protein